MCASAASILAFAATPAGAADWRFVPTVSSAVEYTDNPRLIPGDDESYAGGRGELSADFSVNTERSSLNLVPRFVYAQYPDDPLLDRNDEYVTLAARRAYETVSWSGSASYTRDTTITSEFGLTGLQDVNRVHEAVTVMLGPTWQMTERARAGLQIYGLDTAYEDAELTGLHDYTYGLVALNGGYELTHTVSVGWRASVGELDVQDIERRSRDIDASLSLDWQLAERWHARLSYGPTRVESASGDSSGHVYAASITKDNVRSNVRLAFERDVTPTGRGVLVTRDEATLAMSYALTPRTALSLNVEAVRTTDAIDIPGIPEQTNEFASVESSLRWRCAERWSVVLAAGGRYLRYEHRRDDAEGFNVSVGLVWNGHPRTLSR